MAGAAKGRRGRPSVGPRTEVTTRVRPELHIAMVAVAKARGVTMTKLLETAIEHELGIQTPVAGGAGGLRMTEVA
jgi:hypothetical protein